MNDQKEFDQITLLREQDIEMYRSCRLKGRLSSSHTRQKGVITKFKFL